MTHPDLPQLPGSPLELEGVEKALLALSYGGGLSGGELRRRSAYFLGGYSAPVQDVLRSLFDFSRAGGATLRGYPYAFIHGNEFHVVNAEYRFPIAWIERGYSTFPVYLKRLHGMVYADYGLAFSSGWGGPSGVHLSDFRLGVGGELRLDINFFYYFGATFQLYAFARAIFHQLAGAF